ncbi:sensor histidine kinase [Paenibacillus sp. YIM B09110]|uniref:sensor histidine kinase n=1 Tax=Paenibacillus sp. YIM B09110 TaxID=3126102 RepID=UPI00301DD227
MTRRLSRLSLNSIRLKLVVGVLVITVPLLIFLIYNNVYAIGVVRDQVAESNRNMITLYMAQIDDNLNDIDKYVTNLIVNDKDLQTMTNANSEKERILAKVRLNQKMSADVTAFKSVNSIFLYTNVEQEYVDAYQEIGETQERDQVRAYIGDRISELQQTSNFDLSSWHVVEIEKTYYLFRILRTSDVYAGAWVKIDKLAVPLSLLNLGERGLSLFATENGTPMEHEETVRLNEIDLTQELEHYYLSGGKNKYLVVGEPSAKGNFSLMALIPDEQILGHLPYLRRIVTIISIIAIIFVPACLLLLRKLVLRPLNRIMTAMRRIGDGNMNVRIEPFPTSDEFQMVNMTFNGMMEQIQELRIHVYEEQLSKQKAELQHLQLQINPHFFMNSLNIVYNLALVKNFELIQEMTLCLVQYFRYMFRSNLSFVPLKDEIQHIRNYARIQELRFPNKLSFEFGSPDFLKSTLVPPLVIQSFVENAVKHTSVTSNSPIRISVLIDIDESGNEPLLAISVRDTGKGYPEDILKEIRAGQRVIDAQGGEHIGIWNVQRRLGLLYGDRASISFENSEDPSGAVVRILLPLQPEV